MSSVQEAYRRTCGPVVWVWVPESAIELADAPDRLADQGLSGARKREATQRRSKTTAHVGRTIM